jgi:hypothetical protein
MYDLPPSWGTLYELTKLDDDTLLALIEDDTINPKLERKQAEALLRGSSSHESHGGESRPCVVCANTANVPAGHRWREDDDAEDQAQICDFVDALVEEIERLFVRSPPGKSASLRDRSSAS